MHHRLKINPPALVEVMTGKRVAEVRRSDRGFKVGDTIGFTRPMEMHGEAATCTISHILYSEDCPVALKPGYCILSLADVRVDGEPIGTQPIETVSLNCLQCGAGQASVEEVDPDSHTLKVVCLGCGHSYMVGDEPD